MADNTNQGSIRFLDTQDFALAKEEFRKAVSEYIEAKKQVADTTNALLACWRGYGRQTFQNKYSLFSGKMEDLQGALSDYCQSFTEILDAYYQTDETLAKEIEQSET